MGIAGGAPRLAEWVTLTEAAELLGVTKQAVHKMVAHGNPLKTIHQIGNRPIYIVAESEVRALRASRDEAALRALARRL